MSWKRAFGIVRWLAGLALLVWLIRWVDPSRIVEALADCSPALAATGAALFGLSTLPAAWRLQWLFRPQGLSFGWAFRLTLASGFFSQLLPSGIGGDAYRLLRLSNSGGGVPPVLGLLVFERAIGASTLILPAMAWTWLRPAGPALSAEWSSSWGDSEGPILAAICVGIVLTVATLLVFRRRQWQLRHLALRLVSPIRQMSAARVAAIVALSIGFHALRLLGTLSFLAAVGGTVAPGDLLVVMAMTLLASLVPVGAGALGVREGVLVFGLAAFGVAHAEALTVALLSRLAVVLIGGVGALVFLSDRKHARATAIGSDRFGVIPGPMRR